MSAASADLQVQHGRIKTVQLAEHITTGRQQWLQWHADFAENLPALIQVSKHLIPCLAAEGCCVGPPISAELLCHNKLQLHHWMAPKGQAAEKVAKAVGGLCSSGCLEGLCVMSQDDTELDDQVRLLSGPEGSIRVVQMQPNQLSLKLWEPLCADNPNPGGPPLLLMPPEYDWLDPENGPRELAEIMYIGQRVSMSLVSLP